MLGKYGRSTRRRPNFDQLWRSVLEECAQETFRVDKRPNVKTKGTHGHNRIYCRMLSRAKENILDMTVYPEIDHEFTNITRDHKIGSIKQETNTRYYMCDGVYVCISIASLSFSLDDDTA